jgi:hypothetical protein
MTQVLEILKLNKKAGANYIAFKTDSFFKTYKATINLETAQQIASKIGYEYWDIDSLIQKYEPSHQSNDKSLWCFYV